MAKSSARVAFVGFGEVAAVFSAALREAGAGVAAYDLLLDQVHGLVSLERRALAEGIAFREAPLRPEALLAAAEAFLTGTTAGVWPVGSVDGQDVGEGAPGPVSQRLRERFARVVSGDDPAFAHWLTFVDEV